MPSVSSTRDAAAFPSGPALARAAPFFVFIILLALQPFAAGYLDERWWAVARGLAAGLVLLAFARSYVELARAPTPRECFLAIAVGVLVFAAWICLDTPWAAKDAGPGFDPRRADGTLHVPLAALRVAGMALVVPVMEELFWRSFLLRWIDRRDFLAKDPRTVSALAFALSCALFASEHALWLAGLLAGAAYAALYMRTRNLWIPILSHATTNGILATWILATGRWHLW